MLAAEWSPASRARLTFVAIAVFVGYYLGARLGFALTFAPSPISVLWPPNSILFAALLLVPATSWWLVMAAALPAHLLAELQGGVPLSMVVSWFVSNASEALIGAVGVRMLAREPLSFGRVRGVAVFIFAAFLAAFLSSFLDSALVLLNGWGTRTFWQLWSTRFFSNVTAALTLVPMIVIWTSGSGGALRSASRTRFLEAGVLCVGLAAIGILVFDSTLITSSSPALLYVPLPLLLWAALRFGSAGASTSLAIVAFLAIFGAGNGIGALGTGSPAENAAAVQLFLIFIAPTMLILAAIVEERRHVVQRLRNSEQRFAKAFRSSPNAMSITRRADGRILEVNDQWVRLLGYSREEMVGRDFHDLNLYVGADNRRRLDAHMEAQGKLPNLEVDIRNKRGEILRAVIAVEAVEMDGEQCFITNLRDVTDRRRAEAALRESSERLRLALEAGHMGVWDWDRRTDVVTWSKEYFEIMGLTPFAMAPTRDTWARYVHPDDLPAAEAAMNAAIATRTEYRHEYRIVRLDGAVRWVEARAQPQYDAKGECTRVMGLILDVSERKQAEETSQKLLHASRLTAMGELTASIAHEINQPMTSIMSNVDAAEMVLDAEPFDRGELHEILRDIRSDDLRVSEIVRHVRGLAKNREMEIQALDVNELIGAVLRLIAPSAQRRKISLKTALSDLPLVHGDPIHLQQVLLNLILNAMDAMVGAPEGQRALAVSTSTDGAGGVIVAVRDSGHGVPPALLLRIFDSFVTTKKDGMGLGLSIARSLVEAHGGRIAAENNPEGGATFRFTLPADGRDAIDSGGASAST